YTTLFRSHVERPWIETRWSVMIGLLPRASLNIYQSIPYITSANCIIQPSTHESVQLRRGQGPVEVAERALLFHLPGGVEQTTHRRAVERRGEADPLDAGGRELGDRERLTPDADHKVDRPRHRGTDRTHRLQVGQAGREQHVGPGLLEGLET